MNRLALGPMISTALIGVAGVLGWLFWLGDPCLGTAIANHWTVKNPPVPPPPADSNGFVVVENPYGIMICDYWPTAADDILNFSVFVIVAFAIGWLAARRITQRPMIAATAITMLAMLIALALQYWARWESIASLSELLASLLLFLIAAGIATLGAWVAIRFTRRG